MVLNSDQNLEVSGMTIDFLRYCLDHERQYGCHYRLDFVPCHKYTSRIQWNATIPIIPISFSYFLFIFPLFIWFLNNYFSNYDSHSHGLHKQFLKFWNSSARPFSFLYANRSTIFYTLIFGIIRKWHVEL